MDTPTAPKIKRTTNYKLFKFIDGNRPVEARVNKLIEEMKRKPKMHLLPAIVSKNCDGRYFVEDGQNRIESAKTLKLPIYYIVNKDPQSIEEIARANSVQRPWSMRDYLCSHVALGNPDYITLQNFELRYKLPLTICIELLGNPAAGCSQIERFKLGSFIASQQEFAGRVAITLHHVHQFLTSHLDRGLVGAISKIMRFCPRFDPDRFIHKLSKRPQKMVKCAGWQQYIEIIEAIYNCRARSHDDVPLAFEVKRAVKLSNRKS
jgi:hypothetical protein